MPTDIPADVPATGSRHDRGRRRRRRDLAVAALLAALLAGGARVLTLSGPRTPAVPVARAAPNPGPSSTAPAAGRPAPGTARTVPSPPSAAFSGSWLEAHPAGDPGVRAQAGLLVDLDTRGVLWQRQPHAVRAPASLTKLVTAMVAADLAPLDRQVTVPAEGDQAAVQKLEPSSTLMGISAGQTYTVRDLLAGLFLVSGNDAAETLARTLTDRPHFLRLMAAKAAELGMKDSHFSNPVGLDEPGLESTAWDLAVAAAAIESRYPDLAAIAGSKEYSIPAAAGHPALDLRSLNGVVLHYPGGTGLKTGFTDRAGYCIVATATRGGRHLLAVVLGDDQDVTDAKKLLDDGFALPAAA